ncbi:hypothetical protein AB205_0090350, partial [Aquarana catesbeiana]
GFITIRDRDSGKNGEVKLIIPPNLPFKYQPMSNRYTLVTSGHLDREKVSQYTITLITSDLGSPPLSSQTTIIITISDVNDNPPAFLQTAYNAFISENNEPGRLLCTVSAGDPDEGDNAKLIYSIAESHIDSSPVSSFVYINSDTGNIYAQRSFDYEQLQVLQITARVEDSGSPKLSSNVSVYIFIQDTNDNYPSILYPENSGEAIPQETIPRSASAGYLVSKVSAVDLDSGHNAWLTYSLLQSGSPDLFHISEYTGEVRTLRGLQETDNTEHRLVISVIDHGESSLSSTVTLIVNIMENIAQKSPKSHEFLTNSKPTQNMTLYLIISLVAISLVSLVTFVILLVRCLRKNYDSSCGSCFPNKSLPVSYMDQYKPTLYLNTDGTLKYMEVRMAPPELPGPCYPPCFPATTHIPESTLTKYQSNPHIAESKPTTDSWCNETHQDLTLRRGIKDMDCKCPSNAWKWQVAFSLLLCSWGWVSGQLRYSIAEESDPGTVVGNIAQDLGLNLADINKRRLSLGSEGSSKYFTIDQKHGALIIQERIDRESLCGSSSSCLLHLEVAAENPLELFSLEIEILDINDNYPIFSVTDQEITITEQFTSPGIQFPLPSAEDLDEGKNGVRHYRLNQNPYFSLSEKYRSDGTLIAELVLEKILDREEKSEHKLILFAIDGGEPPRSASTQIKIIVLDINDNAPVFDQASYKVGIMENLPLKTMIMKLNATDLDEGANREILYSFNDHTLNSAKKIFDLNEITGEILIKGAVDYEVAKLYELFVKAVDKGSPKLEGRCVVQVEVQDVNDNVPEIVFTSKNNEVPENAPVGTIVGFVTIRDRDSGKNGEVKLETSPNVPFKWQPMSNRYTLVTSGHLDREKVSQYTITLIASDLGSPSLSSQATIIITISDVNDNHPAFLQSAYNAFISENNDPGRLLCTVSAADPDEGENTKLVYSIAENHIDSSPVSSFVYINSDTGNIYAQRSFDYEQFQVLQITVRVEDSGFPKLISNVSVFIFIQDTNDNYPSILYPENSGEGIAQETIPRSASAGYLVSKVSAVDLDSGHNAWLTYSLLQSGSPALFHISEYTGEVRTLRGLQETDNTEHRLVISISDHGEPSLSSTVTLIVNIMENIAQESPKSHDFLTNSKSAPNMTLYLIISLVAISLVSLVTFVILLVSWGWVSGQLRYSVAEESDPGTVVGNIAQDLGLNLADINKRRLSLGSEGSSKYFNIDKKYGALIIQERIDRESLCGSSSSCLLRLEVVAENPLELFSLEIEILDINDNYPIFSVTDQVIRITEQFTSPGVRFPLPSAKDLDVGKNGVRHYSLNQNPYFSFSEKYRNDGTLIAELVLEKNLDREEKSEHKIVLSAIDGGEPPRSGSTQINIIVLDINDNAPVFDQASYKVGLMENLPLNTVILKLNATDLDDGANSEILYSFDDHTLDLAREMFSLNEITGEIVIKGAIDFEIAKSYEIFVKAVDKGSPTLEGRCVVQVEVQDVNDNIPEIIFTSRNNEVPENAPVGTVIGFITIRDRDSGKNGEVKLIISPVLPFKCQPMSNHYTLVTSGHLDREKVSQYTITLIASDLGSSSLSSQTTIMISISDVNDNPPVFLQSAYNAFISENNEPGRLLCTVSAGDPDEGDNAKLIYSIAESHIDGSPVSSFVYINSDTGNIYAQRSFDYEQIQVLQITAKVEDSGSPKLFSNVSVFIFIQDINDNYPSILYPENSGEAMTQETIPRSVSAGYLVSKVSAVDLDSGHNAWLTYSLLQSGSPSLFHISEYTGEVRTLRGLQETDNTEHRLVISVSDHGEPSLSSTVTLIVNIMENIAQERPKSHDFLTNSKSTPNMTLYLIISLVAISLVFLVTFVILLVRCLRKNYDSSCGSCFPNKSLPVSYVDQYKPTLYLNTDGTLKYMEVRMAPPEPPGSCYPPCFPATTNIPDSMLNKYQNNPQITEPKPTYDSWFNETNQALHHTINLM